MGEIEELLKKDPILSFKLLCFINSCGFGLSVEITSFRHAVMLVGLGKLFRWATLLMLTSRITTVRALTGLSESTLYSRMKRGEFPARP